MDKMEIRSKLDKFSIGDIVSIAEARLEDLANGQASVVKFEMLWSVAKDLGKIWDRLEKLELV